MERIPPPKLREICLSLPLVEERMSHGEPTWFVKKRSFAMLWDHHHSDRVAFVCAAPEGVQEMLVGSEPTRFFRPPYVGPRGWIGVYLDVPVDWSEVEEILKTAHALIAQRR